MSIGTLIKTIQDIMRKDVGVDGDAEALLDHNVAASRPQGYLHGVGQGVYAV